jgi:probable rRNA maturation factor
MVHLTVRKGVSVSRAARARLGTRARRMARAVALSLGVDEVEVGLTLTDDAEIHALNRDYRKKDKPTDVLAFAMQEGDGPKISGQLGDVIISVETARRQRAPKKTVEDEIFFLWSHGLCHLLGYDHNDDEEEAEMNARMKSLRDEGLRRGRVKKA